VDDVVDKDTHNSMTASDTAGEQEFDAVGVFISD
jgi:hypothetical protein